MSTGLDLASDWSSQEHAAAVQPWPKHPACQAPSSPNDSTVQMNLGRRRDLLCGLETLGPSLFSLQPNCSSHLGHSLPIMMEHTALKGPVLVSSRSQPDPAGALAVFRH